jgi:hypothetical protein
LSSAPGTSDDSHNHVLFLLSTLVIGGSERKTVRIANALVEHGRKVTIAYLNGPHTLRDEISSNVDFVCLERQGYVPYGLTSYNTSFLPGKSFAQ